MILIIGDVLVNEMLLVKVGIEYFENFETGQQWHCIFCMRTPLLEEENENLVGTFNF